MSGVNAYDLSDQELANTGLTQKDGSTIMSFTRPRNPKDTDKVVRLHVGQRCSMRRP